jgi:HEAT repeat protein
VAKLRVTDDRTTLEHHDALMALVGALEESDAAVREVMDLLRAGGAGDDLAQLLVVALAAAGSDAAQGALGEILGGAGHLARLKEPAIVAALQVERPNEGIEAALVAIHRESGDAYALCALAAVGDRVRATPERFSAIERTVLRELAGARDARDLCVTLEAVGNLGPAEVPEAVKAAAAHDRADVRLAAARALLRARDPVADRLLAALLGDAEARVRAAALDAIVRRDRLGLLSPEPLPAPLPDLIAGMARDDEDQGVREFARSLAGRSP